MCIDPRYSILEAVHDCRLYGVITFSSVPDFPSMCLQLCDVMRKPAFAIYEQQSRRSACASTHSDQRLCCSLPG